MINSYTDIKNSGKTGQITNIEIRKRFSNLEVSISNLSTVLKGRLTVHQMRIDAIATEELNFLNLLKGNISNLDIYLGKKMIAKQFLTIQICVTSLVSKLNLPIKL